MFSSQTQSTYHNWIRSDYYTLSQILFMYKKTAHCQIRPTQISPNE